MGEIRTPAKVKIIVGILAKDAEAVNAVRGILKARFGEEDLNLEPFPFTFTNYYKEEIGVAPVRAFFSYEQLVDRETIVDIKLWTNDIELEIAEKNGTPGLRPVNLDPGYMTLGQFFLATTKDQRQRVYMQRGIFVEPTLYFQDGHFHAFDWTYRDYQSENYIIEFLSSNLGSANDGKTFRVDSTGDVVTTGLKTINNESIFGDGNITISGSGTITIDDTLSTSSTNPVQNKIITGALNSVVDYIPDGGITRKKLSFPTRPLTDVGTQVSINTANCVAELYLNPAIAELPEGVWWVAKPYNGTFHCRPSNSKFAASINITSKVNNQCYEINITSSTEPETYPVGTLVAYVVFDDVDTLKTLADGTNLKSVVYDFCTNLSNNPVIAGHIAATTQGIPDGSITTAKLVPKPI